MAQQISDLVINLDVDSASFSEQVARIRGQLKGVADESDKSQGRMARAAQIQAAALKQMGEAGVKAVSDIQAKQSSAADEMAAAWKKSAQAVDEAHRRVAEYSQKLQETTTQTAATAKQQDELAEAFYREIDGARRLTSETQTLAGMQGRLRTARGQGKISQQDYLALITRTTERQKELRLEEEKASAARVNFIQKLKSQVAAQNLSNAEMLRYKAAQLGVSDAADIYIRKLDAAKVATHGLGLQSAAARREIGILIGEAARGNFGALRGSGITLANRAGWIDQLMTLRGLGIAGVVGGITASVYALGKAWYEGSQESVEFNKQLILTGSYAGKTSGQLAELAKSIAGTHGSQATSAAVLAQVVGSGSFKGYQIESITRAAVAMQEATGKSVDETIKNFQKLYDAPTKGSAELNAQMHYLTAAQFQYISSLERRGDKEAAGQAAADAYSRAEQQRSQQILDNLGLVERAALATRNAFKGMWDELLNIGRPAAPQQMLSQMQQQLSDLEKNLLPERQRMGYGYSYDTSSQDQEYDSRRKAQLAAIASLKAQIAPLQLSIKQQEESNQKKAEFNQINKDGIDAQVSFNKYLDAGTTQAEKRALAQKDLNKAIADNAKAAKATQTLAEDKRVRLWTPEEIATARAGIEKLYKDPKTPKAKGYVTPAGDRAEDNNQRDLLALQSQLEVLKQHKSVTDSISQQRKELWTAEAQFTVLEGKKSLSNQEKSLLASKKQVLQLANQKAILGDQIVAQEQLNKRMDTASKYVTQMAEKQSALANSATMSDRMAGRESTFAQLRSGWLNAGGTLQDAGYQQQLKAAKDYYAAEDQLRGNWKAGVEKSWADYSDAATNSYEQMKNVGAAVLDGASSQLTSFLTRSGASFKDFTKSILSMLAEILVKMSLVNGVKGASNFFGLEFNANGGVYNSSSLSAYSGSIVDRPTFFAFAKGGGVMGEAGPEAILPLRRGANGKLGVVAGNAGGGSPVFHNTIILQSDGTATSQTSGGSDAMNQAMMKMLDQFCQNNLVKAIRPGGLIFNAMKSR
ncbi:phage tail tape measure protein [Enterobacter sp. Ap-916]|uniref:phage tail tape measure protein n=1 Tax=unclassified Enterobacter TaxID=2608935 RepID=UPI0014234C33|nr:MULTISPECIES: phage tail tape measure protein [unclassified Enterobacter]NIF58970.1 phage tail tape measure protein [Enterobacter sp. Ap-867]NIG29614.1 phage tail tape measure protein [Enterobacter sp. Ap-916]